MQYLILLSADIADYIPVMIQVIITVGAIFGGTGFWQWQQAKDQAKRDKLSKESGLEKKVDTLTEHFAQLSEKVDSISSGTQDIKSDILLLQKANDETKKYRELRDKQDKENAVVQKLFDILGDLGAKVEIKDVEFANPAAGIDFYFSLSDDYTELVAFQYSTEITFPVKGVPVTLVLNYKQKDSNTTIDIPEADLMTSASEIESVTSLINSAIASIKSSNTYSIDMSAINDFDPSATTNAIVDKYVARMYKNGDDFNHSYEYKSHTEEDGAETYKYTLANIQDGSTYIVSKEFISK